MQSHCTEQMGKGTGPQKTRTSHYPTPSWRVTPAPEVSLVSRKFLLLGYREVISIPHLHSLGFCFFNPSGLAIKSMVSQGHGAQRSSAFQAVLRWPSLAPNSAPTSASLSVSPCTFRVLQTLPPEGLSVNLKNILIKLTHRPLCTHFVFYFPSQTVLAINQILQPLWVRPWFGCQKYKALTIAYAANTARTKFRPCVVNGPLKSSE